MRVWCFNTKGGRCVFYVLIKDGKNYSLRYGLRLLSYQANEKRKKGKNNKNQKKMNGPLSHQGSCNTQNGLAKIIEEQNYFKHCTVHTSPC